MNVVPLASADNSRLIEILEEAIADARAGKITGLVLITHDREKQWRGQYSGMALHAAMGYMQRFTYKMNLDWDGS